MNATLERLYKQSRKNGAPAKGALHYARLLLALEKAENEGLISFEWEWDEYYTPDDFTDIPELAEWENKGLQDGTLEVMICSALIPKTCAHCGHPIADEWERTGYSLCGIVLEVSDTYNRRMVEVEMAQEAGVI